MGKQWKQWQIIFLGSKITVDSDCSHEIKRHLLLGRKLITNLDSILKNQRYYFVYKGLYSQSCGFSTLMYRCESWTIKKADHWRTDAFKLCCWRRLLRVPWIARRSTLSSQWKDWCWSRSSNTLACLEDLTHWKRPWCWERLRAGREGGDRGWDGWMALPTEWTWVWASSRSGDGQGSLACCSPWGHKESDMTEWLNSISNPPGQTTLPLVGEMEGQGRNR